MQTTKRPQMIMIPTIAHVKINLLGFIENLFSGLDDDSLFVASAYVVLYLVATAYIINEAYKITIIETMPKQSRVLPRDIVSVFD